MAITDGKRLDETPVGAGLTGLSKVFFFTLAAATSKDIPFGKFKLADVDNVMITFGVGDNGSGDTFQGAPDTTIAISADGTKLTCEDVAGGDFAVTIKGTWTNR